MSILPRLTAALADRYRLDRQLGAGGMATVYLAHDLKHDRPVAIKVLRPELAMVIGPERFHAEIKTTANLQHPHILPLFDSGSADGLLFYVMPYVEGETLRSRLDNGPPFALSAALELVSQLADALAYAHKRGIVHRDVKPENILLHEGRPLIVDFGIARVAPDSDSTRVTLAGMAVGTVRYMSPEQAAGDPEIDGRSDQYSLACVLSEMLAGASKPSSPTAETAIKLQLPSNVDTAIRRATSRDPKARFATISAFADALRVASTPLDAAGDKSIAVLPFDNMSADRDNDYFADGMSEEIINALTQLPGLRVVARTSAFAFKGKSDDLRAIGEKLRVRHVLEGSVRKAGNRLRITVQLVSVADGYHLWSERYDRQMDDVFAIQDEIATTIAAKLQVTLGVNVTGALIKPATDNLRAYDEYLKGVAMMHRRGAGIIAAIECFQRAIALDAGYAPALAGLANALVLSSFWGITRPQDVSPAALDASERALRANPLLVESHVAAAMVALLVQFDHARSTQEWERVLELGPTDFEARVTRAVFYLGYIRGEFDAAAAEIRLALNGDPLNSTYHTNFAFVLGFTGRGAEAAVEARRAMELDPDALYAHWVLVLSLFIAGEDDDVIATGMQVMSKFGRHAWVMMAISGAYARLGRVQEARSLYEELQARSRTGYVQPGVLATTASYLGLRDEAVQLWRQAVSERDMIMPGLLLYSPLTALLRAQPENKELLAQLGWDAPDRASGG